MSATLKGELAALARAHGFHDLRVTTPDTHIPFSPALEKQLYPNAEKIADAVRKVINSKSRGH